MRHWVSTLWTDVCTSAKTYNRAEFWKVVRADTTPCSYRHREVGAMMIAMNPQLPEERPNDPNAPDSADVQAIVEFSREFMAARLSHLDNAFSTLEKSFQANENGASFYEKVILFDGATISLSLSFLGYLTSHASTWGIRSKVNAIPL